MCACINNEPLDSLIFQTSGWIMSNHVSSGKKENKGYQVTSTRYTHNEFSHTAKDKEYISMSPCRMSALSPGVLCAFANIQLPYLWKHQSFYSWSKLTLNHTAQSFSPPRTNRGSGYIIPLSLSRLSCTSAKSTKTCNDISVLLTCALCPFLDL